MNAEGSIPTGKNPGMMVLGGNIRSGVATIGTRIQFLPENYFTGEDAENQGRIIDFHGPGPFEAKKLDFAEGKIGFCNSRGQLVFEPARILACART